MHLSPRSCISLIDNGGYEAEDKSEIITRHWSLRRTIPRNPAWWKVPLATVFLLKTNRKPICGPDFRAHFFVLRAEFKKEMPFLPFGSVLPPAGRIFFRVENPG